MKRFVSAVGFIFLSLLVVGCGKEISSQEISINNIYNTESKSQQIEGSDIQSVSESGQNSNKILVAYFSLVDIVPDEADAVAYATPKIQNTESAAIELQSQVGGDLFAIKTTQTYPVSHKECSEIANKELKENSRPNLSRHISNMNEYEVVYIVFPIWWYQEPMAIRTFLEEYDFSGKTIIPVCTSLGAGISESEKDIKALCPDANVLTGLTLNNSKNDYSKLISEWLTELGINTKNISENVDSESEVSEVKVKITVGDKEMIATFEDNATTKELISQMPMTLPMMDLYGREMCYRYGAYALPTDNLRSDEYEIGDIAYWAPGGSLVILYEQNGERFERQHIGHIDSGVEIFKTTGDTNVTFELLDSK